MKIITALFALVGILGIGVALPGTAAAAAGTADIQARMTELHERMTALHQRNAARLQSVPQQAPASSLSTSGMASFGGMPMNYGGWSYSMHSLGKNSTSYTFSLMREVR